MTIRERTEELEERMLAPYAALSKKSLGRDAAEEPCDIRTCYRRDCDRIIHCKAFRRLKRKTQVFLSPEGDHYRTRLTHTLEVAQIARTIARALRLNEDLTEAISLGHDLGHTPFGHAGERALNGMIPGGFRHYEQSVRVVEKLEKDGKGLNLTKEVRDGILCHTRGKETDSQATGAASLYSSYSSLLLSDSSNPSADVHDGDCHNPPSDMFMADTAANRHIIDSGNMASGGSGAGSHSDAQDGTDGGEATPA